MLLQYLQKIVTGDFLYIQITGTCLIRIAVLHSPNLFSPGTLLQVIFNKRRQIISADVMALMEDGGPVMDHTQNLVDDYDMINGQPAFIWSGNTKTINPASGYDPAHPYWNRDPRFEASIIHDSSVFQGTSLEMWVSTDGTQFGFDSWKQSSDNPRSSYWLRKFMPETQTVSFAERYTIPWPHFRLAEIYLNYAEAKFELGDEAKCREYINKVRARVGMPAISVTTTGDALRQRLYNERRIELAFESHRFFDIRRWKIANVIENRPVYGMDILKNLSTGVKTYTPVLLLQKNPYLDKLNLLPIETAEIRRNPELTQTTGY